jgi:uncharacterized protein YuzE
MEDNYFLNQIDQGYIGFTKPQVIHSIDKGKDLWVLEDGKLSKKYIPEEELDEYTLVDVDNDPASPEQAWA